MQAMTLRSSRSCDIAVHCSGLPYQSNAIVLPKRTIRFRNANHCNASLTQAVSPEFDRSIHQRKTTFLKSTLIQKRFRHNVAKITTAMFSWQRQSLWFRADTGTSILSKCQLLGHKALNDMSDMALCN